MTAPGKRWSTLGVPATEPYQPPDRIRPASWPATGTVGASTHLADDEHHVTLPARPYIEIHRDAARLVDSLAQLEWAGSKSSEARPGWFGRAIGWFRR